MKLKPVIISILGLVLLLQCSRDVDQLKGEWSILSALTTNLDSSYLKLTITNDSITLLDDYQQEIKYPVNINNGTIQIPNRTIKYTVDQSGYLSAFGAKYAREGDEYYDDPHLLKISLPEISGNTDLFKETNDQEKIIMPYGKSRIDFSWALQLNDVLASPKDIPPNWFECYHCNPVVLLAIDRHAPMKNVEEILRTLRFQNKRKVIFVSGDSINYFGRTKKGLKVVLRPFFDFDAVPNAPPSKIKFELDYSFISARRYNLVGLVHNNLFYDSINIDTVNLNQLLISKIKANPGFMTLFIYDNNIRYEQYIRVLDKIHSAYGQIRNDVSRKRYGLQFRDLDEVKRTTIAKEYPLNCLDLNVETWRQLDGSVVNTETE